MDFHHGSLNSLYGVPYPDGGMGIGGCIQDDPLILLICLLQGIYDLPFNIRLEELYFEGAVFAL